MQIRGTLIADTFAEAFAMTASRVIVSAESREWAQIAGQVASGYASSVIGCDCEAGIERELTREETPDGFPGVSLLFFGFSRDALEKAITNRVAQSILTCPTTACYNGLPIRVGEEKRAISIGGQLRYFGDGYQISKQIKMGADSKRFWRIPVMDGEFICEDRFGTTKGIGGGNFLILGKSRAATLAAATRSVQAIRRLPGVLLPFPGGIVRSGSKVGSRYRKLKASTNEAYCPTLKGLVPSALPDEVNAIYELVLDALDQATMKEAMKMGIVAACGEDIVQISAGNYGGKLGPFHFHLRDICAGLES